MRGAAAATARAFKLTTSNGASQVKKYDKQIREGKARRNYIGKSGRRKSFENSVGEAIEAAFAEDETQTYREVATDLGMPKSTVHDFATKEMDFRCLNTCVRPLPSAANLAKRMKMAKEIVAVVGPVKNGMARGHGNFEKLKAMMHADFNIELVQQAGNTPMFNILDLNIWQACQLEVDKMNKAARHCESKLVEVCKKAWAVMPDIKILRAFEMRKDCAQEVLETEGYCPNEGKGRGGAPRVHKHEDYEGLRSVLGIP